MATDCVEPTTQKNTPYSSQNDPYTSVTSNYGDICLNYSMRVFQDDSRHKFMNGDQKIDN
jgi:hypothetical protein